MRCEAVVYVGPSVARARRPALDGLAYRPPIRRGDLAALCACGDRPAAVGIVDGEFDQSRAVSPREILDALRAGVAVYGASSMGALRAAELWTLGMRGVGRVFELYRDEVVNADDEVAILFDPVSERAVTEPLVNVRCALERLQVPRDLAATIVGIASALPYRERTYDAIAGWARNAGLPVDAIWPALRAHDQKQLDALALIEAMRCHLSRRP